MVVRSTRSRSWSSGTIASTNSCGVADFAGSSASILVSMLKRTSWSFAMSRTSPSWSKRLSSVCWASGKSASALLQLSVCSCSKVRSWTALPTYGNCGSSLATGSVSAHFSALMSGSCQTTGTPSLDSTMSNSRVVTPISSACWKASRDSSVFSPRPPRCACRSNVSVMRSAVASVEAAPAPAPAPAASAAWSSLGSSSRLWRPFVPCHSSSARCAPSRMSFSPRPAMADSTLSGMPASVTLVGPGLAEHPARMSAAGTVAAK